jgi:ribonuclease HI
LDTQKVTIYCDGAARGNPGPAAIGVVIYDESNNKIAEISNHIGVATNNQAEYLAIIAGLERVVSLGYKNVIVKADSELVIMQINGLYKIRNTALRPLYQKVVQLTGALENVILTYIPREQNADADALANRALDLL